MAKITKYVWWILLIIPLILLVIGYLFPSAFFSNQEAIREYVSSFGSLAPVVFILLQILQVVITPISHYVVSIAGGYIFGLWLGALYNFIGRVIGTIIAFYIARYIGKKIVEKVVKKKTQEKYNYLFEKGKVLLFLAYFLPLFPDDEISYLAGLSNLSAKLFIPLIILGHVSGSLSLAYIGSGIKSVTDPLFLILSAITLIGGILFIFLYNKVTKSKVTKNHNQTKQI
ncbi:MAG TPA: VTT domain-containing protein [Candidatus Diapherotrites archaeon]|nr:VTT domain-containing protein [Candidatus Diapherotrites archaeon]